MIKKHPFKKKLMDELGYKIADIARYLNLSYPMVSGIMNGRFPCKPEYEKKLKELIKEHEEKF